ncbi:unnamed protein product, partial [Closterium sp. Naga37s-1]
ALLGGKGSGDASATGDGKSTRFLISNFGLPGPVPWEWIRESVQQKFTLDGHVQVINQFLNKDAADSGANAYEWTTSRIDQQAAMARRRDTGFGSYGPNVTGSFYSAFEKYPLAEKSVLVVGSQWPWVEAICLGFDAHAITTVDFNRPVASHPKLRQLVVGELEGSSETWDAAVSFSSLEHDGLGRYGDPINPNGDLQRMQKHSSPSYPFTSQCHAVGGSFHARPFPATPVVPRQIKGLLKPGGLLFLGVPTGNDTLVFNRHRIYGPIRMPLLIAGFHLLDVFGVSSLERLYRENVKADIVQPLLVLRRD